MGDMGCGQLGSSVSRVYPDMEMQEGRPRTLLTQHLADRRDLETRADDDEKVDILAVTV